MSPSQATDLPATVLDYLHQRDPGATVRFDGLVTLSNGQHYLPVLPQTSVLPTTVVQKGSGEGLLPDWVGFDNHFFLLRLVPDGENRLTLPRMKEYPLGLREGLLPQDLVLPSNLFIPSELKVILGALPYNPQNAPTLTAIGSVKNPLKPLTAPNEPLGNATLYLADLTTQSLHGLDPVEGREKTPLPVGCLPSRLVPTPTLMLVTCLNADELVAVDLQSNLVKTRIPVGEKPGDILIVSEPVLPMGQPALTPDSPETPEIVPSLPPSVSKTRRFKGFQPPPPEPVPPPVAKATAKLPPPSLEPRYVAVSHRFSSFLSWINLSTLLPGEKIPLPTPGGAMVYSPTLKALWVASLTKGEVYQVSTQTRKVTRTIATLPGVSALWVDESPKTGPQLWVASRSGNQVQVRDINQGIVIKTFTVGKRPAAMAVAGPHLLVVSPREDRVDVIDWKEKNALPPITLATGSFPAGIVVSADQRWAYLPNPGTTQVTALDLTTLRIDRTWPVKLPPVTLTLVESPSETASTSP